jgi:hypothetical protein
LRIGISIFHYIMNCIKLSAAAAAQNSNRKKIVMRGASLLKFPMIWVYNVPCSFGRAPKKSPKPGGNPLCTTAPCAPLPDVCL